jgi:hypothetical protein
MNIFLKWWLMVTLIVVGISTSIYFNFDTFLFENDLTKLSLVIVSLFVICTSVIGYKIWKSAIQRKKIYNYQTEWFVSEVLISLGMIGTVIGFIFMLYSVFGNLNIQDTAAIQQSLGSMAKGMGTALLTTLVGLISSVLIKSQLVMVENEEIQQ